MRSWLFALAVFGLACDDDKESQSSEEEDPDDGGDSDTGSAEPEGVSGLGYQSHDIDAITVTVVAVKQDGLRTPRDLAFNPDVEGELWVVNRLNDAATIFSSVGEADQSSDMRIDPYALHFMEEVSSIEMGGVTHEDSDARTFGTCQESRNTYNDRARPDDFMGPTLWSADHDIFGYSNPEAIEFLSDLFGVYVDLGSHLDMLHESPMCMGIAWETENVYWVYDGFNATIGRYDFGEDHGVGYDDHSDGIIGKVTDLTLSRLEDVPSHMEVDQASGMLYAVDTGANRVLILDTQTGEKGRRLASTERGTDHHELDGVEYSVFIDGSTVDGMSAPSGLDLIDGHLLITDFETGRILAFDMTGELVDWVDSGRAGGIMGIEARSLDDIWFVDAAADELVRLQP
jgi:hypothetical protein